MSTPRAELSGADDVNKRSEGRETQKENSPRTENRLLGLPPGDVFGAGKLGSWCGLSLSPETMAEARENSWFISL